MLVAAILDVAVTEVVGEVDVAVVADGDGVRTVAGRVGADVSAAGMTVSVVVVVEAVDVVVAGVAAVVAVAAGASVLDVAVGDVAQVVVDIEIFDAVAFEVVGRAGVGVVVVVDGEASVVCVGECCECLNRTPESHCCLASEGRDVSVLNCHCYAHGSDFLKIPYHFYFYSQRDLHLLDLACGWIQYHHSRTKKIWTVSLYETPYSGLWLA